MALPSLLSMIEILPQLIFFFQTISYLIFAWILGSLAFRGMHKPLPFAIKVVAMLGTGFLCLIAGTVIGSYMFFLQGTILQMIQMDVFISGLLAAIILLVAFHMVTRKDRVDTRGETVKKLRERIALLEGLLVRKKVPTLREDEAKKVAEAIVPGFRSSQAVLKNVDWEILLEKEDKKVMVVMGAYAGEVKKIEYMEKKELLSDPVRIIGIGIIISLLAFSLISFRGFPSMLDGIASLLGLDPEQLNMMIGAGENLPEGCVPVMRLLMKEGISMFGGESSYTNDQVRQMVETANPGRQVVLMYETEYGGKDYIVSITLPGDVGMEGLTNDDIMKNSEICSSTEDTFCECMPIPEIDVPTGFIIAI